MLDVKALLTKILNSLAVVNGNSIVIANTIGICWGSNPTGSNSVVTVNLPITYSTTSGMICVASCDYMSSGLYVAPHVSVQKYTGSINLYVRVGTTAVGQGYYVDWLTIGRI